MRIFGFAKKVGTARINGKLYYCTWVTLRTPEFDLIGGSRIVAVWDGRRAQMELFKPLPENVCSALHSWALHADNEYEIQKPMPSKPPSHALLKTLENGIIELEGDEAYIVDFAEDMAADTAHAAGARAKTGHEYPNSWKRLSQVLEITGN